MSLFKELFCFSNLSQASDLLLCGFPLRSVCACMKECIYAVVYISWQLHTQFAQRTSYCWPTSSRVALPQDRHISITKKLEQAHNPNQLVSEAVKVLLSSLLLSFYSDVTENRTWSNVSNL